MQLVFLSDISLGLRRAGLEPVDIQVHIGVNIQINAMVIRNIIHEPLMRHTARRVHKMTDSLVHPGFPSMGSRPQCGQAALLFLQRMNPMASHRNTKVNKAAAAAGGPIIHMARRLTGNGGRTGLTVL